MQVCWRFIIISNKNDSENFIMGYYSNDMWEVETN